jgi:spermidine/putrescine transport system permease protein
MVATLPQGRPRQAGAASAAAPGRRRRSPWTVLRENVVWVVAVLALIYLLLPNLVVVLFSFNKPNGRFNYTWQRFSLDAWRNPCGAPGMCESLGLSLKIGVVATLVATLFGTMIAFALARYRFRGRTPSNLLIFLPMATPEVVMGSSLLALFSSAGLAGSLGFWSILVAHIMFCLSFVVVTVKARLAGLDAGYEQAAMDLYANEWQTFWRVTFPLVFPGILAAALLSFSLSFDDFIVTNFNHGNTITFPMYVWGSAQRGIPPQVNVVGTLMFLLALGLVLGGSVFSRRRPA